MSRAKGRKKVDVVDNNEGAAPNMDWISAVQAGDEDEIKKSVSATISNVLSKNGLQRYTTLFLFDDCNSISNYHADRIYRAASKNRDDGKDILLILQSAGGSIEPAYLISKTLKRLAKEKFSVAIPRRAKSAATLISLGADEIHMGLMSQLGPIDPQFGGLPALALGNALDVIAELTSRFPTASDMLSKYLTDNLSPRTLGYFQRVSESAVQYAERLLTSKGLPNGKTPHQVADHLVNHYKDHGFVIDIDESRELLGSGMIKDGTPEYLAADELFDFLDFFSFTLRYFQGKRFYLVGDVTGGLNFVPLETDKSSA
ncbi:hypothetical protein ILT44_27735 [Microvirga sp. BT689]|uniref:SDH family Clp fold serine proteinase n=1 Tax=Microvirga arvi TaxID=2778731 RepID=UPI00194F2CFC|nr:hypothetical protein [Microvirga arvi]MBM6583996.1 hypothetical protein [Microvirga arvi]